MLIYSNIHTVIPILLSSSYLSFGTACTHLAPCHRPERRRTVMTCRRPRAPMLLGKLWEILGKSWENHGKSWEIVGNHGKIKGNHGNMRAKPGGYRKK